MLCSLLECEFIGFLRRVMGCFFGCFRFRDDSRRRQTHLISERAPSKAKEPLFTSRTPLSDLLLDEEEDGFQYTEEENPEFATPQPDHDERQLKDEARFLKACGTLLETPAEIVKATKKFTDVSPCVADVHHSKFHSWLPSTSIEKLDLGKQTDHSPTPIKLSEEWVKGSGSLELSPKSCISNEQNSRSFSIQGSSATNYSTNKYVRFESENDVNSLSSGNSSTGTDGQNSKQSESAGTYRLAKHSPYPTPLKLSDEMQTPGTVYPTYIKNTENVRNPRIRSQYVYAVRNPVEVCSRWKVLKDEHAIEPGNVTPEPEVGRIEASVEKALKVEASLSSWLKSAQTKDGNSCQSGSISFGNAHIGRTPGDRPIIGMVSAHWNEGEPSRISPKYWNGNGIPNSTNKYKEDQRVSWHATPFEERLEKALSDGTSIPQRKHKDVATS